MLRRLNSLGFKVEKIETSNLRNDHSKSVSKELARTSKETSKSHMGLVKEFSLHELQVATENFSDQNVLGRGGFGIVYKGRLTDGSLVAIKRLLKDRSTTEGEQQFQTELQMIGLALHRNLLKLHGFCTTPKERLLVYPYMANGSVAARLKGSLAPLDWPTRLNVAYGAAKALAYLHDHCDPKIIHRDVKADNVLLDDDYEAIVADFGLVRLMNYKDSHVTTGPCGTPGHIAPEYFTNLRCSEKTDVYGYGILLLELVTGRRVYNIIPPSKREETGLLDWIKELVDNKDLGILVDSNLQGIYAYHEVEELIHVSLLCTRHSPKDRPQMSKVVRMLEDCRSATPRRRSLKRATKSVREKIKSFEFYKLEYATNFFSENNVLGRVSFGKVYKGRLPDGTLVAVKRLDNCARNGELQFQAEVLISETDIKHPNLLPLLGFCKSEQERLLLFPFMEKGSVASYLKGYPNSIQLPPERQKHIALGVARGLSYLHNKSNASNVHVDIKAENIWLDDYFNAAIGDFGLLPPKNCQLVRELRGTGYMAPEHFQTKKSSYKTDVFAYGVLLLELLTGLRAYDFYQLSAHRKGMGFVQGNMLVNAIRFCLREFGYVGLDDCTLVSYDAIRKQETEQLLQLALLCTQTSELSRPKMSKVVEILEGDGWIKGHVYWKEVLKEVEFHKSIGTRSKKEANEKNLSENCVELPPCHEDWTADDIERIAALEKWISKYARSRWWNSVPAINRFPYLKESEMSLEELDGTLSALGLKYADWFGERI